MQGQMDLFNPPDMHIVNVCGELREAPSWMHYKRCENCSAWEMLENNKQPPEGWGIYGWCKETIHTHRQTVKLSKQDFSNRMLEHIHSWISPCRVLASLIARKK